MRQLSTPVILPLKLTIVLSESIRNQGIGPKFLQRAGHRTGYVINPRRSMSHGGPTREKLLCGGGRKQAEAAFIAFPHTS